MLSGTRFWRSVLPLKLIGLLAIDVTQAAPEPGRLYRLLILDSQSNSPYDEIRHRFLDALAEYGYRGHMAASMLRDLFAGKAVSEIEPRRPGRFGYAVNLERAQAYGVAIPIGILQLAGENIRR
ncbi:MAG: hypothetical protein P8103_08660 [Candidatus Thiodiazotropha sp.]